jgi:hypothetical protein
LRTVDPNSADLVIRYRAGSTVVTLRPDSGRQAPPTFPSPVRHDRAPGARPHPQPKPMHPRTLAVVRLEGPLALGHGTVSSESGTPSPRASSNNRCRS